MATYSRTQSTQSSSSAAEMPSKDLSSVMVKSLQNLIKERDENGNAKNDLPQQISKGIDMSALVTGEKKNNAELKKNKDNPQQKTAKATDELLKEQKKENAKDEKDKKTTEKKTEKRHNALSGIVGGGFKTIMAKVAIFLLIGYALWQAIIYIKGKLAQFIAEIPTWGSRLKVFFLKIFQQLSFFFEKTFAKWFSKLPFIDNADVLMSAEEKKEYNELKKKRDKSFRKADIERAEEVSEHVTTDLFTQMDSETRKKYGLDKSREEIENIALQGRDSAAWKEFSQNMDKAIAQEGLKAKGWEQDKAKVNSIVAGNMSQADMARLTQLSGYSNVEDLDEAIDRKYEQKLKDYEQNLQEDELRKLYDEGKLTEYQLDKVYSEKWGDASVKFKQELMDRGELDASGKATSTAKFKAATETEKYITEKWQPWLDSHFQLINNTLQNVGFKARVGVDKDAKNPTAATK